MDGAHCLIAGSVKLRSSIEPLIKRRYNVFFHVCRRLRALCPPACPSLSRGASAVRKRRCKAEKGNNIISHAPYTAEMLMANEWNFPFTRKEAGFPMKSDVQDKYFPHVTRIDDAYGDRNLVCKFSAE